MTMTGASNNTYYNDSTKNIVLKNMVRVTFTLTELVMLALNNLIELRSQTLSLNGYSIKSKVPGTVLVPGSEADYLNGFT